MWVLFVKVVCERESVKTKGVFAGSSRVSFPRSDACALHMTRMRRVRTGWRQLVFASVSRVRPSREIPAKLSTWRILSMTFLPFIYTIYTFIIHESKRGHLVRKNPR